MPASIGANLAKHLSFSALARGLSTRRKSHFIDFRTDQEILPHAERLPHLAGLRHNSALIPSQWGSFP